MAATWAAMVLVAYLHQHPVRPADIAMLFHGGEYEGLLRYPDPSEHFPERAALALTMALAIGGSALGWGTAALRLVRIGPSPLAVRAAFGWAILSLLTLGLGAVGWLRWPAGAALVLLGWAGWGGAAGLGSTGHARQKLALRRARLGSSSRAYERQDPDRHPGVRTKYGPYDPRPRTAPGSTTGILFSLIGAVYLVGLLSPEIFYDALVYHLGLPDRYIQAGRIEVRPDFLFAQFPQGMEMLYTLGLLLQGEMLARLLNGLVGVTALLAVHALAERIRAGSGWIAALIFASSPVIGVNTVFSGSDLAMAMFALAAILVVADRMGGDAPAPDRRQWGAAGFLAGCAAGVKYTGIVVVAGMILVLAERAFRERWGRARALTTAGAVAAGAALPVLPWLVKNWAAVGNPVYPFLSSWFGVSLPDWMPAELVAANRELPRAGLLDWLLLPWRMTMGGSDFGSFAGPAFLMFFPIAFTAGPASRGLAVFTLGGLCLGLLVTDRVRFLMPALGGLSALIGARLAVLSDRFARRSAQAIRTVAAGAIAAGLYGFGMLVWGTGGWRVVLGQQSRSEYLESDKPWYPAGPVTAIDWINRNLPSGARVLFLGEERTYGVRRPVAMQSVADRSLFLECVRGASSPGEVSARVRKAGYSHILLNGRRFQRLLGHELAQMSDRDKATMDAFMGQEARVVFEHGSLYVIEVPPI